MRMQIDREGFRYWTTAIHGRGTLWRHMNDLQKTACAYLEKLGWTLVQLDDDRQRQAYMYKPGEMIMTIRRN